MAGLTPRAWRHAATMFDPPVWGLVKRVAVESEDFMKLENVDILAEELAVNRVVLLEVARGLLRLGLHAEITSPEQDT